MMLCIVVLALVFCKLLAHLLIQKVKKAKEALSLFSRATTGPRQKRTQINSSEEGRTNRNLFVSWSTESVDSTK